MPIERTLTRPDLHRTPLELVAERELRRRQLTDAGNVEITGRDLLEREVRAHYVRSMDIAGRSMMTTTLFIELELRGHRRGKH